MFLAGCSALFHFCELVLTRWVKVPMEEEGGGGGGGGGPGAAAGMAGMLAMAAALMVFSKAVGAAMDRR